jgi:hypothetical protein
MAFRNLIQQERNDLPINHSIDTRYFPMRAIDIKEEILAIVMADSGTKFTDLACPPRRQNG